MLIDFSMIDKMMMKIQLETYAIPFLFVIL